MLPGIKYVRHRIIPGTLRYGIYNFRHFVISFRGNRWQRKIFTEQGRCDDLRDSVMCKIQTCSSRPVTL